MKNGLQKDPRSVLAGFYAAYFACAGILMPFLPPWIKSRGFDYRVTAVLLALLPMAKVLAPWVWGVPADRTGSRKGLLIFSTLVSTVSLALLFGRTGFLPILVLLAMHAFTTAPALPFAEATTMEQAERHGFAYGPVRLWGSIAFMVVSLGFGAALERFGVDLGMLLAAGFLAVATILAMRMPRPESTSLAGGGAETDEQGRKPGVSGLLSACFLMQVSHGAYYAFYSIRLQELGYGGLAIGALWALAVLCEVTLLTQVDKLILRFGTRRVQQVSILAAALRWLIIAVSTGAAVLALAQTMHALTYASFHVASLREVHQRFEPSARATGQAMYSGLTFGLGIFVGTLVAGSLAGLIGFPSVFGLSAGLALIAFVVLSAVPRIDG